MIESNFLGHSSKAALNGNSLSTLQTTVFLITIGDRTFPICQQALQQQNSTNFKLDIIQNYRPMSAAFQEMIARCETDYFIQVDEDMILSPNAVETMEQVMKLAPENVGMICFHLYDEDRECNIQGIKIYKTSKMKSLIFHDVKACEMDLLEQMGLKKIQWILHPEVMGRHGTLYTPDTIYRRYKSLYEKDIVEWNTLATDVCRKAKKYKETGDPLQLFALLGAIDGIVTVPYAQNREKDFTHYDLKALNVFKQLFLESPSHSVPYEVGIQPKRGMAHPPIPMEDVEWKPSEVASRSIQHANNDQHLVPQERRNSSSNSPSLSQKRILLACQWFWPSVGGVETIVAHLGRELINAGYQVDIATVAMPERVSSEYHGMRIISLNHHKKIGPRKIPALCAELYQLLNSGDYRACILFANPHNWLITSLLFGDISPNTKLFIQPLVNQEGYEEWKDDQVFYSRFATILKNASGVLALTQQGIDATFLEENDIPSIYLPNATGPMTASTNFRQQYDIPQDTFMVLHVGNIWKVKNQLGLLGALPVIPANWKMVMIGHPPSKDSPTEAEYGLEVMDALQQRPEILYIPGLPIEDVAAAMHAADVVILTSHAEISPMAIVEAMSYQTAWLATPVCGDVHEKAGGIVAPLDQFSTVLQALQRHPSLRQSLGELGHAHWQSSFRWDIVKEGWIDVLETGHLRRSFQMPQEISRKMDSLQLELNDALARLPMESEAKKSNDAFREGCEISYESTKEGSMNCLVLIFSRDRALQLDATLRSFLLHCRDAQAAHIRVLYTTTSPLHSKQYDELIGEYGKYSCIRFIREQHFRSNVLTILPPFEHVLFLVDDNIFVRSFSLQHCVDGLTQHSDALACSLRLGRNTSYCYSFHSPQDLPQFSIINSQLSKYSWPDAQHDFGYPLEVSSSLYRVNDVYELISRLSFCNPNTLEGQLAEHKGIFEKQHPCVLCYDQSVTFCNPINMVQTAWKNRAGQNPENGPEQLAQNFEDGYRVKVEDFSGFTPNAAHQEVELKLDLKGKVLPAAPQSIHESIPTVSVVIPCYNQGHFLSETVLSVVGQSYQSWEIIIVDDGSSDDTSQVAERLIAQFADKRIRLIRQQNQGLAATRNIGIRAGKGKYILPLDADDCLHPEMLQHTVELLDSHQDIAIAYPDTVTFGLKEEYWPTAQELDVSILCQRNLFSYCALFRRDMWEAVGGYNNNMVWGYEDWDFWISCAERGYGGRRLPQGLFLYRVREGSMYSDAQKHDKELIARIILNHPKLYDEKTRLSASQIWEHAMDNLSINEKESLVNRQSVGNSLGTQVGETEESAIVLNAPAPGKPSPLVSVIVPTFNRPAMLKNALQSILAQSLKDFEIIVVNDAGEDVQELVSNLNQDGNITYVRHGINRGLGAARNSGLGVARGKYIAYLDDDDRFYPDHLETLVSYLDHHEEKVVYSDAYRVHQVKEGDKYVEVNKDLPYSIDFNFPALLISNYFPVLCVMHEKACLCESGWFDETLSSHEDWDLWIRLGKRFPFVHIKKVTAEFSWRNDGTSMTSRMAKEYQMNIERVHNKHRELAQGNPEILRAQTEHLEGLSKVNGSHSIACSIIIPVFNKVELTQQCLTHLAKTTQGHSYEVILVDNASTDETSAYVATLSGDIRVIKNQSNLGFAVACNQGAKIAKGRYLVFLNNDTIPQPGWLHALVEEAESQDDIAVVGSKLLYPDGKIQHAGVAFCRKFRTPFHIYNNVDSQEIFVNRRREYRAVTAACMLVKRERFEAVGGFDEGYVNGFEDADFCLKIGERGWKIVYQPKSWLYHLESQTEGRKKHDSANAKRLLEHWGHKWLVDEDTYTFEDGLVTSLEHHDGRTSTYLRRLTNPEEVEPWRRVANLQKFLLQLETIIVAKDQQESLVTQVEQLVGPADLWPNDFTVMSWGAEVCRIFGLESHAEGLWRRILSLGEDAKARVELARLAMKRGLLPDAQEHLSQLMRHHSTNGDVWVLQGIYCMQIQQFAEAQSAFEKAMVNGGNLRKAHIGLGMAEMGLGRTDQAWKAFQTVLSSNPDDTEAIHWLIRAGTARADWDGLSQSLTNFLERNPADSHVRFALAGVHVRCGRIEEARLHYDMVRLLTPDFEGLDDLAKFLEPREAPTARLAVGNMV